MHIIAHIIAHIMQSLGISLHDMRMYIILRTETDNSELKL